jgi:hypothetical protein
MRVFHIRIKVDPLNLILAGVRQRLDVPSRLLCRYEQTDDSQSLFVHDSKIDLALVYLVLHGAFVLVLDGDADLVRSLPVEG